MNFRLALIQMQVTGGDLRHNLGRAEDFIAQAANAGAQCALLPEAMDIGWTHSSAASLAGEIPGGEACVRLSAAARRHRIHVCAGLTENDGGQIYNAAVIIDSTGNVILKHRKLNELTIGHASYAQGDRLGICHTELGTLGLMICADGFARDLVLARALGYMGAEIILSPSAWAMPAEHDNRLEPYGGLWRASYIPVAREFSLWIAGCSNVGWINDGPWKGRKCIGCSLVIGPDGGEVLQGPYGVDAETILYVDVQPVPRPARGCGWEERWQKSPADQEG